MNDVDALVIRLSIMIAQLQQANEQLKAQLKFLQDQQPKEIKKESLNENNSHSDTLQRDVPRSKPNRA